jgi:hypothetical protein
MNNTKQTNNNTEDTNSLSERQDVTCSEARTELSQSPCSNFTIRDFYRISTIPSKIRKWNRYEEIKDVNDEFIAAIEKFVQLASDEPDKPIKL